MQAMKENGSAGNKFVVEDFPRTQEQLDEWLALCRDEHIQVERVVYLEQDDKK